MYYFELNICIFTYTTRKSYHNIHYMNVDKLGIIHFSRTLMSAEQTIFHD